MIKMKSLNEEIPISISKATVAKKYITSDIESLK